MKTSLKLLVGAALLATSMASFAAYTPGAGITGTKHDWSATNGTTLLLWLDSKGAQTTYNTGTAYIDPATGKQGTTKVTIGLCTKCHTPHQAKSTNLLWNHTLQAITYKWDEPATTAGTEYATFKGDTYKGPTTKCLCCHDGLLSSTDGMWFNRAIDERQPSMSHRAGSLNTGHEVADGTNMSKSHPVAMPYPLNGASNTYNFSKNGANIEPTEWVADPMATNKIRLYQRRRHRQHRCRRVAGQVGDGMLVLPRRAQRRPHQGRAAPDRPAVRLEPRSGWIHLHAVPPQVRRSQLWRRGPRRRALFLWRVRGYRAK